MSAGENVTPVVISFNESANLTRALDSLHWAARVIVLDSGSTDDTERIARSYSNVDWRVRPFDSFRGQWLHGVHETGIATDFVLALDADMAVPAQFVAELEQRLLTGNFAGGVAPFEYRYHGRAILRSFYPPQVRVFRRDAVRIEQVGHNNEFVVKGPVYRFRSRIVHDDRKPLERWVASQLSYSAIEAQRLGQPGLRARLQDRLRRTGLMPVIAAIVAYLIAGGPFRSAAATRYAYERATYEALLAIRLLSSSLEGTGPGATTDRC